MRDKAELVFNPSVVRQKIKITIPKTIVQDGRKAAQQEGVSFSDFASFAISKAIVKKNHVEQQGRASREPRERSRPVYSAPEGIAVDEE